MPLPEDLAAGLLPLTYDAGCLRGKKNGPLYAGNCQGLRPDLSVNNSIFFLTVSWHHSNSFSSPLISSAKIKHDKTCDGILTESFHRGLNIAT
jgi:hypothetical protein